MKMEAFVQLNLFSSPSSHTMWPPGAKATNALACRGFEVALCNHNNGPTTVPSLATLRQTKRYPGRKRCLQTVALSTETFCLQYVQYVLCILQWFAGLLYIYIHFHCIQMKCSFPILYPACNSNQLQIETN